MRNRLNHVKPIADRMLVWLGEQRMPARVFAHRAGISETTIYTFLAGQGMFSVRTLMRMCRAHHISADWLLFGKGDWRMK